MIVEDELIIAMINQRMMEDLGFEILSIATSGTEAIDIVKDNSPDLILMDIMIEGEIDGIQTMENIRSFSNVPVIYLTGNSDVRNKNRAERTSFIDFLVKPVSKNELKKSVQKLVGGK
ncbi:MAG: response regulator [Crocinitomicaceae bacterium]|nr:response regulator [Crocinitomicaceae bacterium]